MKKFFLISTTIIILSVTILTAGGCSTNAAVTYVAAEFIGSDFELVLPEKWEGGTKKELDSVAEDLKEAGRAEIADKVVASKKDLLFFGYDTEDVISNDVISTLTICGEPSGSISLEEYIEISYKNIASSYEEAGYDFKIIEKEVEIEYFEIYLDGFSRDGCKRISYCSGDCDRCACLIDIK